ncbi:unnamed protein product [Chrysoparadoxa australica]
MTTLTREAPYRSGKTLSRRRKEGKGKSVPCKDEGSITAHELQAHMLTEDKLQRITGTRNLAEVKRLELGLDMKEMEMQGIGQLLPALQTLVLDTSKFTSFRDLGTGLRNLLTLSLESSRVADLDGICVLANLRELRLRRNAVDDLSPLAGHDSLRILDLADNKVIKFTCIQVLGSCRFLDTFDMRGNPIASVLAMLPGRGRDVVCEQLPQLLSLDGTTTTSEERLGVREEALARAMAVIHHHCKQLGAGSLRVPAVEPGNDSSLTQGGEVFTGSPSQVLLQRRGRKGTGSVSGGSPLSVARVLDTLDLAKQMESGLGRQREQSKGEVERVAQERLSQWQHDIDASSPSTPDAATQAKEHPAISPQRLKCHARVDPALSMPRSLHQRHQPDSSVPLCQLHSPPGCRLPVKVRRKPKNGAATPTPELSPLGLTEAHAHGWGRVGGEHQVKVHLAPARPRTAGDIEGSPSSKSPIATGGLNRECFKGIHQQQQPVGAWLGDKCLGGASGASATGASASGASASAAAMALPSVAPGRVAGIGRQRRARRWHAGMSESESEGEDRSSEDEASTRSLMKRRSLSYAQPNVDSDLISDSDGSRDGSGGDEGGKQCRGFIKGRGCRALKGPSSGEDDWSDDEEDLRGPVNLLEMRAALGMRKRHDDTAIL